MRFQLSKFRPQNALALSGNRWDDVLGIGGRMAQAKSCHAAVECDASKRQRLSRKCRRIPLLAFVNHTIGVSRAQTASSQAGSG